MQCKDISSVLEGSIFDVIVGKELQRIMFNGLILCLFLNPPAEMESSYSTAKWLTRAIKSSAVMIANVPFPHFPVAQEMNRRRRHKTLCDDEGSDFFLPNATLSEMSKRGGGNSNLPV